VAKYDSIPAPLERVEHEAAFYSFAQQHSDLSRAMPELLGWLADQFVLVLQDLGSATDATCLYSEASEEAPDFLGPLLRWLRVLHEVSLSGLDVDRFRNRQLRALNHAHLFEIPFQDPAVIDLDRVCPGLAASTDALRRDNRLKRRVREVGEVYLSDGDCLLHGDFFPGSWLLIPAGPKVIDPEFCFAGPAEFDVGVALAHLKIIGYGNAEQLLAAKPEGQAARDWKLIRAFAAVEVLRRLLGVAQLPLSMDLTGRHELIEEASAVLLGGD
jgi:5-methylthioribose kinase